MLRRKKSKAASDTVGAHVSLSISDTRDQFSETVNRVHYGGEVVVLERHGRGLVAMVPIDEYNRLLALNGENELKVTRARTARSETRVQWKATRSETRAPSKDTIARTRAG